MCKCFRVRLRVARPRTGRTGRWPSTASAPAVPSPDTMSTRNAASRRASATASATALRRATCRDGCELQRAQRPVRARCGQPRQHIRARPARNPPASPASDHVLVRLRSTSTSGSDSPASDAGSPGTESAKASSTTTMRPGRRNAQNLLAGVQHRPSGWWGCRPRPGRRRRAPAHRPGRTAVSSTTCCTGTPAVGQSHVGFGERRRDERRQPSVASGPAMRIPRRLRPVAATSSGPRPCRAATAWIAASSSSRLG